MFHFRFFYKSLFIQLFKMDTNDTKENEHNDIPPAGEEPPTITAAEPVQAQVVPERIKSISPKSPSIRQRQEDDDGEEVPAAPESTQEDQEPLFDPTATAAHIYMRMRHETERMGAEVQKGIAEFQKMECVNTAAAMIDDVDRLTALLEAEKESLHNVVVDKGIKTGLEQTAEAKAERTAKSYRSESGLRGQHKLAVASHGLLRKQLVQAIDNYMGAVSRYTDIVPMMDTASDCSKLYMTLHGTVKPLVEECCEAVDHAFNMWYTEVYYAYKLDVICHERAAAGPSKAAKAMAIAAGAEDDEDEDEDEDEEDEEDEEEEEDSEEDNE